MDATLPWPRLLVPSMKAGPASRSQPHPDDPDAVDVARAAAGDQYAFTRLVDRHLERVHRLAWRSLGNPADAEEVTQETFLRAYRQLPDWQPGRARFSTWLYRVALNLCRDQLRARRDWVEMDDLELHDNAATPEHASLRHERRLQVEEALARLPRRQREAMLLYHYEGQSQAEAAGVLEVSIDAFESLLARARRNLRQLLPEGHDREDRT